MNEKVRELWIVYKKYWYAPLMIALGIALMLIRFEPKETEETVSLGISDQNYVYEIESRIEEMLKGIDGAGDCEVTITLASGGRKEYVREDGRVLVITDKDGNQSAVISKENAPEIAGVTVISSSEMNINVKNNIVNSIGTVLGVGTNKICVVFLNGG